MKELEVKCPHCGGIGIVKREEEYFCFQCTVCGKRQQKERAFSRYQISEMCNNCDRHFRLDIDDENRQHLKILNVNCPYCDHLQQGTMQKIQSQSYLCYGEIKNGIEPYFGFPLYYQTSFDDKIIWAYNREHLVFLINYVKTGMREHVYNMPKFITLAKNRNQIVKLLKRLLYNE